MSDAQLVQLLQHAREQLAPAGVVRAAINLGNTVLAQRSAGNGELGGVSVDLARALATEEMKAQGRIADSLARSGQTAAAVAPPAAI
ncbi:hypothetical protein PQR75_24615 [Paraburkholderia fungorum]|uniref:hypothetical protein n=1 Tax=Paraburkholderia fungorum TaxID=134537 RepID=UPI0038B96E35